MGQTVDLPVSLSLSSYFPVISSRLLAFFWSLKGTKAGGEREREQVEHTQREREGERGGEREKGLALPRRDALFVGKVLARQLGVLPLDHEVELRGDGDLKVVHDPREVKAPRLDLLPEHAEHRKVRRHLLQQARVPAARVQTHTQGERWIERER